MTNEDGVTLPEINRNVIDIRRQLENMSTTYVSNSTFEERMKNHGERLGRIESDIAELRSEKRQSANNFHTSFLYPLVMTLIGAGVGVAIALIIGAN